MGNRTIGYSQATQDDQPYSGTLPCAGHRHRTGCHGEMPVRLTPLAMIAHSTTYRPGLVFRMTYRSGVSLSN